MPSDTKPSLAPAPSPRLLDWTLFLLAPAFFSSNLIFGRGIAGEMGPFTTALIRWAGSALIMSPVVWHYRRQCLAFVREHTLLWLMLGILGMGICGGGVYWALTMTTASNATLIYTTSSLFIILFEWLLGSRRIRIRELAGMVIAFAGVAAIVLKGDLSAILHLHFNLGDLAILAAAVSFAVYSILLRRSGIRAMPPLPLFGLLALSGAIVLVPPGLIEIFSGGLLPDTPKDFAMLGGIILFASLAAFYCFQHAVHVFGAGIAGMTLYLMPPMSIVMAVVFLGETFERYHAIGIVLVTAGLVLATLPHRRA
jgi:drug/metabolite transporter (DMT)-like permease